MKSISENIKLNKTSDWGAFKAIQNIPIGYGRKVAVAPIQYSKDKRQHALFSHPIERIFSVIDRDTGKKITTYDLANAKDRAGNPISLIRFVEPIEEDSFYCIVEGKTDSSNQLIINPADVIYDLLVTVSGLSIDRERFDFFRAETEGIELAGVIREEQTINELIKDICSSIYAGFNVSYEFIARLLQNSKPDDEFIAATFNDSNQFSFTFDREPVTELRLNYGYNEAVDVSSSVTLRSDEALASYGGDHRSQTIDAPWLSREIDAINIGSRLLRDMSRHQVSVSIITNRLDLMIGPLTWIKIDSKVYTELNGDYFCFNSRQARRNGSATIFAYGFLDTPFSTELFSSGVTFDQSQQTLFVRYIDGVAVFTIVDNFDQPLAGVAITINAQTLTTNRNGEASFVLDPGSYVITITREGFETQVLERNIG